MSPSSSSVSLCQSQVSCLSSTRYLLGVEYAGARFHGFQRQPQEKPSGEHIRTVQGTLESALSLFAGCPVNKQTKTQQPQRRRRMSLPPPPPPPHAGSTVRDAVNHYLRRHGNDDIRVTACIPTHPEWHPRFSALGRVYRYVLCEGGAGGVSVFQRGTCWSLGSKTASSPLNVDAMRDAAAKFLGEYDFTSFRANGCQAASPVRTVTTCSVDTFAVDDPGAGGLSPFAVHPYLLRPTSAALEAEIQARTTSSLTPEDEERAAKIPRTPSSNGSPGSRFVVVTVGSPGFLYHQVRLMVGALVLVGTGKITPEGIAQLLTSPVPPWEQSPNLMAAMAPAHGLFLCSVEYDIASVLNGKPRESIAQRTTSMHD
ncbi:tRNA pseudouridine synthase [Pycnococcus provasolii]